MLAVSGCNSDCDRCCRLKVRWFERVYMAGLLLLEVVWVLLPLVLPALPFLRLMLYRCSQPPSRLSDPNTPQHTPTHPPHSLCIMIRIELAHDSQRPVLMPHHLCGFSGGSVYCAVGLLWCWGLSLRLLVDGAAAESSAASEVRGKRQS